MKTTDSTDIDAFARLAVALADAARPVARRYFRGDFAIDDKEDQSPVTIADREMESVMRRMIEDSFPDHGILGEEHGAVRMDAEWVWVLDPIDGTAGFVTGKPLFGTLIALTRNGRPVVGVIDAPAMNERWLGIAGRPTLFDIQPVKSRDCGMLDRAWLYATSPQMFTPDNFLAFERLRARAKKAVFGADCYAYGLLASGFVDLVCEADLKPYDYCALAPVIEGAGGRITDWNGDPLTINSDGRVLAAGSAAVHAQALAALEWGG